ncbi:hypothetical protein N7535_005885 [Penicillium sp. DV-2018c]|nr:hypothetical protein N7461_009464 [Penicillium sp. DV-2018c]KAJ5572225.1 hypothetical protein N7535_005885 [Penicillium sp. DV-2018c]
MHRHRAETYTQLMALHACVAWWPMMLTTSGRRILEAVTGTLLPPGLECIAILTVSRLLDGILQDLLTPVASTMIELPPPVIGMIDHISTSWT